MVVTDSEKLQSLLGVSRLIASRLELKSLISEVVQQASKLVSADRSTLWLYDEKADELYTFHSEGLAEQVRIPLSSGVAGAALRERRTIVINDAYASEYFNPDVDKRTGYRSKSLLAVPMVSQDGRILGSFQSINRLDKTQPDGVGVFSEEDVALLTALAGIAAVAVENAMLYAEQRRQFNSFIVALAGSVDAKDITTSNHTRMVTGIAVALAQRLELPADRIKLVRVAAILHDYGKIGVPDSVLNLPGKLEGWDFVQMRSHCIKTFLILSRIRFGRGLEEVPRIAGMHHEKLDGAGYPFGLRGEEIPLESRILAVADVYQALTQTRPYKTGRTPEEALAVCRQMATPPSDRPEDKNSTHLDARVVNALEKEIDEHGGAVEYFEQASGWDAMLSGELA
jgi:HD-GYP domain-containing protein (c-di-GMP phosphodiesterase class II)